MPYYDDGRIVLYHGSCLDVLPAYLAVDHVITDPPYARDVYRRMDSQSDPGGKMTAFRGPNIERMAAGEIGCIDELLAPVAAEIARLTKRWAIVFSDIETCHLWRVALEAGGMRYVRTGAWIKPDPMPQFSGDRPGTGFEPCTIAHAAGAMRWNGGGHPAVWHYGTVKGADRADHPCPKPLALMEAIIEQFTDAADDLILDPFAGSGTTLVAARNLGRRAVGIEISEEFCAVAANRLRYGTRGAVRVKAGQIAMEEIP